MISRLARLCSLTLCLLGMFQVTVHQSPALGSIGPAVVLAQDRCLDSSIDVFPIPTRLTETPMVHPPLAMASSDALRRVFVLTGRTLPDCPSAIVTLDATNGTVVRTEQLRGTTTGLMAVDDRTHHVFTVSSDGTTASIVTMVSARTGRKIAETVVPPCDWPGCVIAAAGWSHRLLVSSIGSTRVIDTVTGRYLGSTATGEHALAVDSRHHRVYGAANRKISILDSTSGRITREWQVGDCANKADQLALDPRAHRLYLARSGTLGDRYSMDNAVSNPPGLFCTIDSQSGRLVSVNNEGNATLVDRIVVARTAGMVLYRVTYPFSGFAPVPVVNARSGKLRRQLNGPLGAAAVDEQANKLYVVAGFGTDTSLREIDGRTLRVRRVLTHMPPAFAMLGVPRAHRLFMAFHGVAEVASLPLPGLHP